MPGPNKPPAQPNKGKRPAPTPDSSQQRKRARPADFRTISTQTTDRAYTNGELNVSNFVKAREYEIKALEDSMSRAKKSLNARAFQSVPRDLRRRTASHNANRVPKRVRARAKREMLVDNTPTVQARRRKVEGRGWLRVDTAKRLKELGREARKMGEEKKVDDDAGAKVDVSASSEQKPEAIQPRKARKKESMKAKLQEPPLPPSKYRKRQKTKTWLPTHLWHAKRATMTPPMEPLWRFALPLTPTAKCYRPTHRAANLRGAVAWDASYMSTIGLEGVERSIMGIFKALGVKESSEEFGANVMDSKYVQGTRAWHGWVYERNAYPHRPIAPVTVIWRTVPDANKDVQISSEAADSTQKPTPAAKRKALIRVHPSAFLQLWEQTIRLAKVQKPSVSVEDLRFEIGSIEIRGPGASEALVGVLRPCPPDAKSQRTQDDPESVWSILAGVVNPTSLPRDVLVGMDVVDPRLQFPPKTFQVSYEGEEQKARLNLLCNWSVDRTQKPPALFERNQRLKAGRSLPSQKNIDRRKRDPQPGEHPAPLLTDPQIPALIFVDSSGSDHQDGQWTLLVPWKCVTPIWKSLMQYPLSTGGNVRFGGVMEQRQLAFETGRAWFPGDFPGTWAGDAWDQRENDRRKAVWDRHPKGKRVEYESVNLGKRQDGEVRKGEIGAGWACDWQQLRPKPQTAPPANGASNLPQEDSNQVDSRFWHLGAQLATDLFQHELHMDLPNLANALFTAKITLVKGGAPKACARIYRLPTNDDGLRAQWLSLEAKRGTKQAAHSRGEAAKARRDLNVPSHVRQQKLAASLLEPPKLGSAEYPVVPDDIDLIGFLTTGNFNLSEGKSTGVGCLSIGKVLESQKLAVEDGTRINRSDRSNRICIVRDAGQSVGRLATWDIAM